MKLLLLAGTAEARAIAAHWAGRADREALASLAGATAAPKAYPVPTRIGGFGGVDGMSAFLAERRFAAVVDATHPFAERISANARAACAAVETPYLRFARTPWRPTTDARWLEVDGLAEAAAAPPSGARVLIASGRSGLEAFAARRDLTLIARVVDPPAPNERLSGIDIRVMRPPFPLEAELAFFAAEGFTHIIAKNAGGPAGAAKLEAARRLGLACVMIRPPTEPEDAVFDIAALEQRLAAL